MEDNRFEDDFNPNGDISFKQVILKIKEIWAEIKSKWLWVLSTIIVSVVIFTVVSFLTPVTYNAKITFMVNEDEGGGKLIGILGKFGLGGTKSDYNLAKILSLSQSGKVMKQVLFEKVEIEGKNDFIANHLIIEYDLHENWEDSKIGLQNFLFTKSDTESFSKIENTALKTLYYLIVGNPDQGVEGLFINKIDEATAIMELVVKGNSEAISIELVDKIYQTLSKFYIDKSIERQKSAYDLIKVKNDSLIKALDLYQFQLLKFEDSNRSMMLKKDATKKLQLQRKIQTTAMAYGKIVENLEIADFSLKNATPFFQLIDEPMTPLRPTGKGLIKNIILGIILGLFLSVAVIIGRKVVVETLNAE